jgi:hypothetical protein
VIGKVLPAINEDSFGLQLLIYWLGAICTLGIYTVLYRENRVYRFFEHFYIGLAVGFGLVITVNEVLDKVWWKAMMTEQPTTVASFDKVPSVKGVELDKTDKREGEGSWLWRPSETPLLRLTNIPTDWGMPNYMKLWLWIENPVPNGQITLKVRVYNPDTKRTVVMSKAIGTDFSGWRELLLPLREFEMTGDPYRAFEKVGKYGVLGDVTGVEFEANKALQTANVTVRLDDLRHCIGYRWWWAFALVIGLMFYTVFSRRFAWMSRLALSIMMGFGAGYAFKGFIFEVVPHIQKSFKPIFVGLDAWKVGVNNAIFVAVLLCVMIYFFFSIEHRHPLIREPARLGRWLLMLTFGIVFGNTVMGRFSLFISRLDFLLLQNPVEVSRWAKLGMVVGLAVVLFLLAFLSVEYERRKQQTIS